MIDVITADRSDMLPQFFSLLTVNSVDPLRDGALRLP